MGTQRVYDTGNRGVLLADSDVDADHCVICAPVFLLVDDRVDRNSGLACLSIANDQFSLAATNRNHGVDGFDARLQRFFHRLSGSDARRNDVKLHGRGAVDGTFAIQRLAKRVDHSAEHGFAHGHFKEAIGRADRVTFTNGEVVAINDGADGVFLQVHRLAHDRSLVRFELEKFTGHDIGEAVDASDAVTDLDYLANLRDLKLAGVLLDFLLDD